MIEIVQTVMKFNRYFGWYMVVPMVGRGPHALQVWEWHRLVAVDTGHKPVRMYDPIQLMEALRDRVTEVLS